MVENMQRKNWYDWKTAGISHKSMRRFRFSFSTAFANQKAACSTSSSTGKRNLLFNTCWAKMEANCGILEATHSGSWSYPTNHFCRGETKHSLITNNVPAQQSTSRALKRVKLRMMAFIHNVFFCTGWSKTIELYALKLAWKTRSFCGTLRTFAIWFVHLRCVAFTSPRAK